jgi:outer membrane protein OmpA-like peptidoglycan-associated protein/tetratricopeptide (TPR) repeat protein
MYRAGTYTLTFFLIFIFSGYAQMRKGDRYFNNGEYYKAIPHYKKEARSKNPQRQQEALGKLGDCYRLLSRYDRAEEAYEKLFELNPVQSRELVFNYAQILKTHEKYDQAAEQYANYIKQSPDDEQAKNNLKFCKEIRYYQSLPLEYSVTNIAKINTRRSEFSPYVTGDGLVFTAEREQFDFFNFMVDARSGQPYSNVYISPIKEQVPQKAKPFSKKVNSVYHDGPGSVSADGQMFYFTRVDHVHKKNFLNRAGIYTANRTKKSWRKIKALDLNDKDYSIAHPSVSNDGNTLFFCSDMPGGFGGKDIYMTQKVLGAWGPPVNLGPDVNTNGDEMFPCIRKDGTLFFSSNGLPGFGGLDIFTAKMVGSKWALNRNEGLDLNSSKDDFGITFLDDTLGFFSSNRPGGKGMDDIYMYEYTNKSMIVQGNVLLTENLKDYAKGKKILLLDELGNVVDSVYTDDKGHFAFKNLDGDKKFLVSVVEEDPELVAKARFYLSVGDSLIHRVTGKYKDARFVFRNMPIDPNGLPDMYTEDEMVFAGTIRVGEEGKPLTNVKLKLVNDFGDVVEEATTNEYGAFAFRNIPSDQNYMVSIEEGDVHLAEGTKIVLTNKSGKDVRTFYKEKKKFTFKILKVDRSLLEDMDAEDVNLVMGVYGFMLNQDKKPIGNVKLKVREEDGSNEQEWTTTANGRFNFKNLDAEKNYIFEADGNDPILAGVTRIYIADGNGRIYKIVELMEGKFAFKILEVDKFSIGEFVVDDPTLKIAEIKKKEKETVAMNANETKESKEVRVVREAREVREAKEAKAKEAKEAKDAKAREAQEAKEAEAREVKEAKEAKTREAKEAKEKEAKESEEAKEAVVASTEPKESRGPVKGAEHEEETELSVTIFENIYYAYGSYAINDDGKAILDKAAEALMDYPKLIMEINSHTDSQSSSGFNLGLSKRRAQTIVEYLVNKRGISRSRLKATGFGETRLLNDCYDGVECTDAQHKINRRTEFRIIKKSSRR